MITSENQNIFMTNFYRRSAAFLLPFKALIFPFIVIKREQCVLKKLRSALIFITYKTASALNMRCGIQSELSRQLF